MASNYTTNTNNSNTTNSKSTSDSRFSRMGAKVGITLAATTNFFKRNIRQALDSGNTGKYSIYALIFLIVMLILFYMYKIATYTKTHCGYINSIYTERASIANLDVEKYKDFKLRDFYIRTAYNCCAIGNFTNTFVDLCALDAILKQGVRCLDFEIYAVDNKPVVAVSANDGYYFKQSFNYLSASDVLNYIGTYAFSGAICPNYMDPLILHFRLKTKLVPIINLLGKDIKNILGDRLLDNNYNDAYFGKNLGGVSISNFMKKIIIAVNIHNQEVLKADKLMKVTNIESGSPFFRMLRKDDVLHTPSSNEITEYNKQNMSIALPDVSYSTENLPFHLCLEYGIQMIGMCYQNFDPNMELCAEFFGENNSAFVLKPESLRYEPIVIEKPKPLPKDVSFKPRHIQKPYYSFKI